MKCSNCGKSLGCGCQKRVASNGTSCCSTCLAVYEAGLMAVKTAIPINKIAPTDVKVLYKGPGKQH